MDFQRLSAGVGISVQKMINKASLPWKIANLGSSATLNPTSGLPSSEGIEEDSLREDYNGHAPGHVSNSKSDSDVSSYHIDRPELPQSHQYIDKQIQNEGLDNMTGSQAEIYNTPLQEAKPVQSEDSPYAVGPGQIVMANDGTKECLAILITERMVSEVKHVDEARYKLEINEERFGSIQRQVAINEMLVEQLRDTAQATESEEEQIRTTLELEERELKLLKDNETKNALKEEIRMGEQDLRYLQNVSNASFKRLFIDAELMSPPKPDTERNAEIEEESRRTNSITPSNGDVSVKSIENPHHDLLEQFFQEQNLLNYLRTAFDNRKERYQMELEDWYQFVREGRTSATRTEFDLCYLEEEQNLTRDLINAETAYEETLIQARRLNLLEVRSDQGSDFPDDVDDGYSLSFENEMAAVPNRNFIERWLDTVTEAGSTGVPDLEENDIDFWDAKSIAISDSFSCHEQVPRRARRINQWHELCEIQRQESERLRKQTMGFDLPQRPGSPEERGPFVRRHSCSYRPM